MNDLFKVEDNQNKKDEVQYDENEINNLMNPENTFGVGLI